MPLPDIPSGLEDRANAALDAFVAQLGAAQDVYLSVNGKKFQGLSTHAILPEDGVESVPGTSGKPRDQTDGYNDVGITFPATSPISCACDVYQSAIEWGCTARGELKIAGRHWMKIVLAGGAESEREMDWTDVTEEEK